MSEINEEQFQEAINYLKSKGVDVDSRVEKHTIEALKIAATTKKAEGKKDE